MNPVILTLFGEEYAPQPAKAARKNGRAKASPPAIEAEAAKIPKTVKKKVLEVASHILDGWNPEKQYYTIGEVASLFKVNTSHIRFWTKEFTIKVRTTRKGDRLYTPEQIYFIRTIYHLVKERGFTLAGARAKLKEEKKAVVGAANLRQSLVKLRTQLTAIRQQLT